MSKWTAETNEEFGSFLKDWLKQQGKTQADLSKSLQATSTRMPALLEVLENDYRLGGLAKIADRLCQIEKEWENRENKSSPVDNQAGSDPLGQLDLILQEIQADYEK